VVSRLAESVLIPPFPGTVAPGWLLSALERGLAGVTLFAPNVAAGPAALAGLTASLREAGGHPLVAVDEEGGDVTRLWYGSGSPYPGNAALGAVDDTGLTEQVHAFIGADLLAVGVNLDLAPCLDVLAEPSNPVVGTRSFGPSADLVARHGAAAVRGLQSAGIAACAKHFPGHGSTVEDSHEELAVVSGSLADVRDRDLPPFLAAVKAGVLTVMPGHLRVPELTGALPASLSGPALSLLRAELGFTGVIVTDALEMKAVSDAFGDGGGSVRALAAGCDVMCLGRDVSEERYLAIRDAIAAAVRSGELPGERLEEASARAGALRAELVSRHPAGSGTDTGSGARDGSGIRDASGSRDASGFGDASGASGARTGLEAARRALRETRQIARTTAGPAPSLDGAVVVEVEPTVNIAAGKAHWGLSGWVPPADLHRVAAAGGAVGGAGPEASVAAVARAAQGRPLIVVFRDAHRSADTRSFVTAVLAQRPDTVLVEMGLPYWMPPASTYEAHLATYGASRANTEAAAEYLGLTRHTSH
jgi:beta-N-acetylhexosaminidase